MTFFKPFTVVLTASAFALSGCVTDPSTVRQSADKTALYGLGGAAVCGIMGALTHGGKGARNSALVCGALGAGKALAEPLLLIVHITADAGTQVQVQRQGNQIKLVMPENVTFATGSAVLSDNAQFALNTAAQTLVQYPDTTLTINGHTDNTGSDAVNNPLSQHRAQTVAYYLQSRGVAASRLAVYGYGSHMPAASNATAEGRAQNRRVEILINPDQHAVNAAQQM